MPDAQTDPREPRLSADGTIGEPGVDGLVGADGSDGADGESDAFLGLRRGGSHGEPGQRGQGGLDGDDGQDGATGVDAGAIHVTLTGSPDELTVSGSHGATVRLGDGESRLLLSARGGDGGPGGRGGDGGLGGEGGRGENGAHGSSGSNAMFDSGFAGSGGDGGDGGDGGAGGSGGRGGRGGVGGNGGTGGRVTVTATDPRLLMLVDVDVSGGRGGPGGEGGDGGAGGQGATGGKAGRGGAGGSSKRGFGGASGSKGRSGRDGRDGREGGDGADGAKGRTGSKGSVGYVVVDDQGRELARSKQRFDVTVTEYRVRSRNQDEVFEPGENITIDQVEMENSGDLALPAGARLSFPTTPTVESASPYVELPALEPGERHVVPGPFEALLVDETGESVVRSRVELLGRPFQMAAVPTLLDARYPIVIDSVVCPPRLGRGEQTSIDLTLLNVSSLTYGPPTTGTVSVRCSVGASIECSDDPIDVDTIEPGSSQVISVPIRILDDVPLYSRQAWHVELLLRGRAVVNRGGDIQVVAGFDPAAPPTNVLLWHSATTTQAEHLAWSRLLGAFGLSYRVWDADLEGQSSPPAWAGRTGGGVVIAAMDDPDALSAVDQAALESHFQAHRADTEPIGASSADPGAAILGLGTDDILARLLAVIKPSPELLEDNRGSSWISFSVRPDSDAEANELRSIIEHNDPSHRYVVRIVDGDTHEFEVLRSCLRQDDRLVAQPRATGQDLGEEWLADPQCTTYEIGSAHAQVAMALALALPLDLKLNALHHAASRTGWRFLHPDWSFELADVVGAALYSELETELHGQDKSLPLLATLSESLTLETSDPLPDEAVVAILTAIECLVDEASSHASPWIIGEGARRWRRVRSVRKQVAAALLKPHGDKKHRLIANAKSDRSELASLARRNADGLRQLLEACPVEWPLRVLTH